MDAARLCDVLRDARAGRSLRDLAKKLGIAPSYLSDIENDRRIPSEDLLRRLAAELGLDVDRLMALAGRLGDQAERYLKRHPTAGVLLRRIAEKGLADEELQKLLRRVERMGADVRGETAAAAPRRGAS